MVKGIRLLSTLSSLSEVYRRIKTRRPFLDRCALCLGSAAYERLCEGCRADLPYLKDVCPRCAGRTSEGRVCGRCLRRPPPFSATRAVFAYTFPIDKLVQQLKYREQLEFAVVLGQLFADHLVFSKRDDLPQCIVPVPLHKQRARERGFNQALELARPVARRYGIPLRADVCSRIRYTPPQVEMNSQKERRNNLRGAFMVKEVPGRYVVIFDDVVTTGATVRELAQEFSAKGASRVEVWCCCRAMFEIPRDR